MLKNMIMITLVCFSLAFSGCSSSNSKPLSIEFASDSSTIVISNIDKPGLLRLKQLNPQNSLFTELISVLQTPSEQDTAIREELIPGKYAVSDTSVVFIPTQPFVKGREYLVITHMNAKFGDAEQVAKGQLSLGVKPIQKSLVR